MKRDTARYVLVPIVTALSAAMATVAAAYVGGVGFSETRDPRLTPVEPVSVVDTLAEPVYDGVKILKDVRILDLRGRVPVPPEKKSTDRISSATWVRSILLKKLRNQDFVEFESATTGAGIDARSLTHHYEPITTRQPHFHGKVAVKPVVLKIDISNEPVGREFLVVNEMTYWNAFTGEDTDWAAMHQAQDEEVAMVVLFPKEKPVTGHQFFEYQRGHSEMATFRGRHRAYVSENGLVLFWSPEEVKRGFVYQVNWKW